MSFYLLCFLRGLFALNGLKVASFSNVVNYLEKITFKYNFHMISRFVVTKYDSKYTQIHGVRKQVFSQNAVFQFYMFTINMSGTFAWSDHKESIPVIMNSFN